MYLQSFENNGSQPEQYYRYDPEIHGGKEILEKPFFLMKKLMLWSREILKNLPKKNLQMIQLQYNFSKIELQ